MDRDPDKYEARANFQLVYTGQYRQHACPFTGKEVTSESPQVEVDGGSLGVVEELHHFSQSIFWVDTQCCLQTAQPSTRHKECESYY